MAAIACITTEHGSFNCICQVAPTCTPCFLEPI